MATKKKVKIRVLPLRGIGGIGDTGATALVSKEEAEHWIKEGYAEIVTGEPEPVPSSVADANQKEQLELKSGEAPEDPPQDHDMVEEHDHDVMKPENKRDG